MSLRRRFLPPFTISTSLWVSLWVSYAPSSEVFDGAPSSPWLALPLVRAAFPLLALVARQGTACFMRPLALSIFPSFLSCLLRLVPIIPSLLLSQTSSRQVNL